LAGGTGADILDSKGTLDIMVGGARLDVFTFTVLATGDRVLDFVKGEDRLDISALLPNFQPGEDLDQFVRLQIVPAGTRVSIDPSGSGANFQLLAASRGVRSPSSCRASSACPRPCLASNAVATSPTTSPSRPSLSRDGQFVTFGSLAGTWSTATTTVAPTSSSPTCRPVSSSASS
jgi:hypothetical protein